MLLFSTNNTRFGLLKQHAPTTDALSYSHISQETMLTGSKREGKCVINDRGMVISAGWLTDPTTRLHRSQSTPSLISTHYCFGHTSDKATNAVTPKTHLKRNVDNKN